MKVECILNQQSTGLLTNLEFSEKANYKILSWMSICLLKYLTEFTKYLIIPISALYS